MATASDNFTRANETPLAGNWDNPAGGLSNNLFDLISNQAVPNHTTDDCNATWKTSVNDFGDDQFSEAAITTTGSAGAQSGAGVIVRGNGQSGGNLDEYRVVINHRGSPNPNMELARFNQGNFTSLEFWYQAWSDGDILRLEISGYGLTVKLNGSSIKTHDDSGSVDKIASGQPGIAYSSDEAVAIDTWQGGDLAAPPPSNYFKSVRVGGSGPV